MRDQFMKKNDQINRLVQEVKSLRKKLGITDNGAQTLE
jgi:hypothetical protein